MTRCGYCAFGGNHHQCPGGTRQGNGSIHRCSCRETERCGQRRCTECNNREEGTVGEDWRCLDKNDCRATIEARLEASPLMQRIKAIQAEYKKAPVRRSEELEDSEGVPRAARSRKAPSEAGKPCTCGCGETTGGGRFRPGHDSKYLNQLVEQSLAGEQDLAASRAAAISEAFAAKLEKRLAK